MAALGVDCCVWGFSRCGEQGCPSLQCAGSWYRERGLQACRLSSCGTWAWLFHGIWDLPRPEVKPVSPALAGGFLTPEPPRSTIHTSNTTLALS